MYSEPVEIKGSLFHLGNARTENKLCKIIFHLPEARGFLPTGW